MSVFSNRFMRALRALVAVSVAVFAFPASAAFTYFGEATSHADNTGQDNSVARAITPPASMATGDLVVVYTATIELSGTLSVSASGGQTWNSLTQNTNGQRTRIFWAEYNGTWSADPSFVNSVTGVTAFSAWMVVFRPASASCTIGVDVSQSNATYAAPSTPFDVTITGQTPTSSASVVTVAAWASIDDNTWSLQTGGWTASSAQLRNSSGTDQALALAYLIQSSASATGNVTNRQATLGGDAGETSIVTFSETSCVTTPTFTSAPAIGTRTTSAIPWNFTSDTTGTVHGVRMTDGSSIPTCDAIEAETVTGGLQYFHQAVVATVADADTFSGITDGTKTDGAFCIEDGSGNDSAVYSSGDAVDMYKQPAFPVAPNVSARSSTTQTVSYQLDGPGTVYVTGAAKGKGASTYAQCAAGQDSGSAATTNNNESTSGAADSIVLTYSSPLLVKDINVCATYGSQQSGVTTLATEIMGAESGYTAPAAFASLCNALPCPAYKYNAENATDIIDGDYNSCTTATSPDALATTWDAAGYFSYSGSSARQLLSCKFQDVSAFGMFAGANPAGFYINNQAPVYSPPTINVTWRVGDALSFNNLDGGLVLDAEGDTLTGSNSSTGTGSGADTRPAGTSFGGSGNGVLSGTLTDVASGSYVFTATDIAGDSATLAVNWEVRAAQETVPDCATTNIPLSECDGLLEANYLQLGTLTTECSELDRFDVISQNPAAGTSQDPETEIDLVIAKRCGGGGAFRWPVFKFGE